MQKTAGAAGEVPLHTDEEHEALLLTDEPDHVGGIPTSNDAQCESAKHVKGWTSRAGTLNT